MKVYVLCDGRTITLEVMEHVDDQNILHCCPKLDLQHPVLARRTEVNLVSRGLTIKLFKQEDQQWDQLSLSKFHWIKIDPEFFDDLEEDDVLDQAGLIDDKTGEDEMKPQVCRQKRLFSL